MHAIAARKLDESMQTIQCIHCLALLFSACARQSSTQTGMVGCQASLPAVIVAGGRGGPIGESGPRTAGPAVQSIGLSCCQPFRPASWRAFFLVRRPVVPSAGHRPRAEALRPHPTASTMPNAAAFAARAPLAAARGGLGIEDDRAATTSGTPTQPCAVCGRSRYAPTGRCTPPAPPPSAAPPHTGAATRH